MARDVFISYATEDKRVADAVCAALEARSIRCWIAPRDVVPGTPYGEAIVDAIQAARVMVVVFSSPANASLHIPKEVERAASDGLTIIPFRIENVLPVKALNYFLASVHWLDALTLPMESHLPALVNAVEHVLIGATADGEQEAEPAGNTSLREGSARQRSVAVSPGGPAARKIAARPKRPWWRGGAGRWIASGTAVLAALAATDLESQYTELLNSIN